MKSFANTLLFIPFFLIFFGCPVNEENGEGFLSLILQPQNSSIRTILPEIESSIDSFRLSFNGPELISPITTTESTLEILLKTGTWDILVEGLNSDQETIAAGEIQNLHVSGNTPITEVVYLFPSQDDFGRVDISVTWPGSITIPLNDDNIKISFDGSPINLLSPNISYTYTSINFYSDNVQSGSNHTFQVILNPVGSISSTKRVDAVHIYDGVTTRHTYSLEELHFHYIPNTPSELTATTTSFQSIELSWTDNANNEEGFSIERSVDGNSYSVIDTVSANITSYIDSNINLRTYYYRVLAYNFDGFSTPSDSSNATASLIINHSSISLFDNIPQFYIDEVKKALLILGGESHGRGYMYGLNLIEEDNSYFSSNVTWTGSAETYTDQNLRANRAHHNGVSWEETMGEEDFYTSTSARNEIVNGLSYIDTNYTGNIYFGFGWCWDMTWLNPPSGIVDPVYGCRWAGSSVGGPEGGIYGLNWGLDDEDTILTDNSVNMQTYLDAVELYRESSSSIRTIFTTGPVDGNENNENGYQRHLKHEYIRDYVVTHGGILLDYADILSWDYSLNERIINSWGGHTWDGFNPDFEEEYDGGKGSCHISAEACRLLGKAIWIMLAMDVGWEGI